MLRTIVIGAALQGLIRLATALSLTNFLPLPDGLLVPVTCTLAYEQTIPNCVTSDFLNGAACSSGCVQGLNLVSLSVNTDCPGVVTDSNTLLGKIFQGELVSLLCPNTVATKNSETSTSRAQQKTTAEIPPATASAKVTSISSIQTTSIRGAVPSPASIVESNSFSVSTRTAKSSAGGGLGDSTSTTSSAEQTSISTKVSTQSASPKETEAPKKGGSSAADQQAAALQGTGGGSLFDIQLGCSTRSLPGSASLLITPICMLCLGIILGR